MSREAILARVRAALEGRADVAHPTTFESWGRETQADPVEDFALLFAAAGGEVVRLETVAEARAWLADFRAAFVGVVVGQTVPDGLDLGLAVQMQDGNHDTRIIELHEVDAVRKPMDQSAPHASLENRKLSRAFLDPDEGPG